MVSRRSRWSVVLTLCALVMAGQVGPAASTGPASVEQPAVWRGDEFALLAERGIVLGRGATVDSGHVAVSSEGQGQYLSSVAAELVVERDVQVRDPDSHVYANRLDLAHGAVISHAHFNTANLQGSVQGSTTTPVELPMDVPTTPTTAPHPGDTDVEVTRSSVLELEPGAYGALMVARDATVVFTGGAYEFSSVTVDRDARLHFDSPATVSVEGSSQVARGVYLGPSPDAVAVGAAEVVWDVSGSNASSDQPSSTPAASFDRDAEIRATLRAMNGTLAVGRDATIEGSLRARWITVGRDSTVEFVPPEMDTTLSDGEFSVTIVSPTDGDEVHGSVPVQIVVGGGASMVWVTLLVDGETVAGGEASGQVEIGWDADEFPAGTYELSAMATDGDGVSVVSAPVVLRIPSPDPGWLLLEDDFATGVLTSDDHARYGVYRWFAPHLVPEPYRIPEDLEPEELTLSMMTALREFDDLSAAVQDEIVATFTPEGDVPLPTEPFTSQEFDAAIAMLDDGLPDQEVVTGAGLASATQDEGGSFGMRLGDVSCGLQQVIDFAGHLPAILTCKYSTRLVDFVYSPRALNPAHGIDTQVDELNSNLVAAEHGGGPNGVPDALDAAANAYYQAARDYRDLGFPEPRKMRAFITGLDAGLALPAVGVLFLDRDGLVYLTRHELFHQFQYELLDPLDLSALAADMIGVSNSTIGWWLEASAEWGSHKAEEQALGPAGDSAYFASAEGVYARHIGSFLNFPERGLAAFRTPVAFWSEDRPQYGAFIFAEYLEQRFGAGVIAKTWHAVSPDGGPRRRAIDAIAHVLREQHEAELSEVVVNFHRANYTIRDHYVNDARFAWADLLPEGRPGARAIEVGENLAHSGLVALHPGGAAYLEVSATGSLAQEVTVRLDGGARGQEVEDIHVSLVPVDTYPELCAGRPEALNVPVSSEPTVRQVLLAEPCRTVVVKISNANPQALSHSTLLDVGIDVRYSISSQEWSVAAWGAGQEGALGDGASVSSARPVSVVGLTDIVDMVGTTGAGLALDGSGRVWSWGYSAVLGNGGWTNSSRPVPVSGLTDVVQIARGRYAAYALDGAGRVWAWGNEALGAGDNVTWTLEPIRVPGLPPAIVQLANGRGTAYALDSDGGVWSWGEGRLGQLGTGDLTITYSPVKVEGLEGIVQLAGGALTGYALDEDGRVWGWGTGAAGGLGPELMGVVPLPTRISGLADISQISSGETTAYALDASGRVWSWGPNIYGERGHGVVSGDAGTVIGLVAGLGGVTQIASAGYTAYALDADGRVRAWGDGALGQLGNGGNGASSHPVFVSGLTEVTGIAAGTMAGYAFRSTG